MLYLLTFLILISFAPLKISSISFASKSCFGLKCYFLSNSDDDYYSASKHCHKNGGRLAQIRNRDENEFLHNYARSKHIRSYWISGTDEITENVWHFSDTHEEMHYKNWGWWEPNNSGNEDCIQVGYWGTWNDNACWRRFRFICEQSVNYLHKKAYKFEGKSYYVSVEKLSYDKAASYCQSEGMTMALSISDDINDFIYQSVQETSPREPYYINGIYKHSYWQTNQNHYLFYTNWNNNEPNNMDSEFCIEVNQFEWAPKKWNNIDCKRKNYFVCEKINDNLRSVEKSSAYKYYRISNAIETHKNAMKICSQHGLRLAHIDSSRENTFVFDMVKTNAHLSYWIDLSDKKTESHWLHSDGQKISYSAWNKNEPNGKTKENCVEVLDNKKWNDIPCDKKRMFVCEKPQKIMEEKEHALTDYKSYKFSIGMLKQDEAIQTCEEIGYQLAQISSESEHHKIREVVSKTKNKKFWIDGNYKQNNWIYSDGVEMRYHNWENSRPNYSDKDENCIIFGIKEFTVENCQKSANFICERIKKDWFLTACTEEKCYYISTRHLDYITAKKTCEKINSRLVRIESEAENRHVFELVRTYSIKEYWINGVKACKEWKYNDKTKIEFTNWHQDEPSATLNKEHCLEVGRYSKTDQKWNDQNCKTKNLFVCEKVLKKIVKSDPMDCKKTNITCIDQIKCEDNYCRCTVNDKLKIKKMWLRTSMENYVSGINGCGSFAKCKSKNFHVHKCVCDPGFTGNGFTCTRNKFAVTIKCGENVIEKDGKCVCKKDHVWDEFKQNCEPPLNANICAYNLF